MTKEQEIMDFLREYVFDPILNSPSASATLKRGVNITIARMSRLPANKMVGYYWSAIVGTDNSIKFAQHMRSENFRRFEEVIDEFRVRFNDAWLAA